MTTRAMIAIFVLALCTATVAEARGTVPIVPHENVVLDSPQSSVPPRCWMLKEGSMPTALSVGRWSSQQSTRSYGAEY